VALVFLTIAVALQLLACAPDEELQVVEIKAHGVSIGSGVVVGNEVVTAHHVITYYNPVQVCYQGPCTRERLVRFDGKSDLASLTWSGKSASIQIGEVPSIQDNVTVCGYPAGNYQCSNAKVISNEWPAFHGTVPITPLDLYIAPGISGGPVLDQYGNLVGVAYASSKSGGVTYTISASALRAYTD